MTKNNIQVTNGALVILTPEEREAQELEIIKNIPPNCRRLNDTEYVQNNDFVWEVNNMQFIRADEFVTRGNLVKANQYACVIREVKDEKHEPVTRENVPMTVVTDNMDEQIVNGTIERAALDSNPNRFIPSKGRISNDKIYPAPGTEEILNVPGISDQQYEPIDPTNINQYFKRRNKALQDAGIEISSGQPKYVVDEFMNILGTVEITLANKIFANTKEDIVRGTSYNAEFHVKEVDKIYTKAQEDKILEDTLGQKVLTPEHEGFGEYMKLDEHMWQQRKESLQKENEAQDTKREEAINDIESIRKSLDDVIKNTVEGVVQDSKKIVADTGYEGGEGIRAVLHERGKNYGQFIDNGKIAQRLKAIARDSHGWRRLDRDQQEAMDIIFSKLARALSGDPFHIDNWTDIAGYATLVEDRLKEVKRQKDMIKKFQEEGRLSDGGKYKGWDSDSGK